MVVLGQSDNVTLGSDLEAAATGHFDVRTFELRGRWNQGLLATTGHGHGGSGVVVDGHVELVSVRVANQDVASVGDVNTVGKAGHVIAADFAQKLSVFIDNCKNKKE